MTSEEAIRQLRHNTDAVARAPEALQLAIDAIQELSALKAMRALSSRPPTLEHAHEVIAKLDADVTGVTADVVSLRQRLQAAQAAFANMRTALSIGTWDDEEAAVAALGEALGVRG